MADETGRVAYMCMWCAENFHDLPDDDHSQAPRPIYIDYDGNQYCTRHCRYMATDYQYDLHDSSATMAPRLNEQIK